MKKSFLLMVLIALLCVAGTAGAELKTVEVTSQNINLYVGKEQTYLPTYPDYSSQFGHIYDQDDFIITYETDHEGVTIAEDGTLHIAADAPTGNIPIMITYTFKPRPSSQRVNKYLRIFLVEAPTKLVASQELVVMTTGSGYEQVNINIPTGAAVIKSYTYDDAMVTAVLRENHFSSTYTHYLTIEPVAVGESYITLRGPNNIVKNIKVVVVKYATKLELSADHYVCNVGDTIDLGIDLGNGPYGVLASVPSMLITENGSNISSFDFQTDECHFYADRAGIFDVKIQTYSHSATARIEVYDQAACTDIALSSGTAEVGTTTKVILYDANGNAIFRPARITSGYELTSSNSSWSVKVPQAGSFTITVQNPDGSTYTETFEAGAKPTDLTITASSHTMQIGDVFDLNPTFDVEGDFTCEYEIYDWSSKSKYGIVCVRLEGSKVIAQGPGEATVYVRHGSITKSCRITVEEGDAQISIVLSEDYVGVGKTVQATVQDKTGKVYPATFSSTFIYVDVTEDGQVTGLYPGSFRMTANLEDGRTLEGTGEAVIYPEWLHYGNVVLTMDESKYFSQVETNQGNIDKGDVTLVIEDTTVAEYIYGEFWPVSPGITKVTITSKYSGVSTTFTIEVIDDKVLYAGSTSMYVPYGFAAYLPVVTNASGKEMKVNWKITQNTPGEGNPDKSAFILEGDMISCVWPEGSCVVTGTASNKATVKVNVYAYYMPGGITIKPETLEMECKDTANLTVQWDDASAKVKTVYWIAETEGILSFSEVTTTTSNNITAKKAGTTQVMAMLDNGAYAICEVTVTDPYARRPGDANEDGVVDANDALLIMQYDAGWNVSINGYAGDVNADGKTNLDDALLIFKHGAGLDVQLKQYVPEG